MDLRFSTRIWTKFYEDIDISPDTCCFMEILYECKAPCLVFGRVIEDSRLLSCVDDLGWERLDCGLFVYENQFPVLS